MAETEEEVRDEQKPVGKPEYPALWDSVDAVRESAARAALVGLPLAELQDQFTKRFAETQAFLETRFSLQDIQAAGEAERVRQDIINNETRSQEIAQRLEAQSGALAIARERETELEADTRATERRVRAEAPRFRSDHERTEDLRRREREVAESTHQRDLASSRADVAKEDFEKNERVFENRASGLRGDLEATAAQLTDVNRRVERLQGLGLTMDVVRFLHWAAFFSFGGIGIVLAELFASRLPGSTTKQPPFLLVKRFIGAESNGIGPFEVFFRYAGLLTLMAGFLVGIVLLTIRLMSWLDPTWRNREARSNGSSAPEEIGHWLSMFQFTSASTVARRLQHVDRRGVLQLVSALPIALGVAVLAFFWIITTESDANANSQSLQLLFVGVVYSILASSSGLLFWLFVLKPGLEGEPRSRLAASFYSALFLLPIVGLVVAGTFPSSRTPNVVAALAVSLLVGTVGLGHAIFGRGLILRQDYLMRLQERQRAALDAVSRVPTAETFMVSAQSGVQVVTIVPRKNARHRKWWAALRRPDRWLRRLLRPRRASELNYDPLAPAELVDDINSSAKAYAAAQSNRERLEKELADSVRESERLADAVRQGREALNEISQSRVTILDHHKSALLQLLVDYQKVEFAASEAYALAARTKR